jgi:hypothetical protein
VIDFYIVWTLRYYDKIYKYFNHLKVSIGYPLDFYFKRFNILSVMEKKQGHIKNIFFFTWLVLLVNVGLLNAGEGKMLIYSTAFSDGSIIPVIYVRPSAGGENISPPISWSNLPDGTKSVALSVVDIHPIARNWVHWLVINIPKDSGGLAEGASHKAMPSGSRELKNSFKDTGYGGPQPPYGTGLHPYIFTVYALDIGRIDIPDDITLDAFMKAIRPHVLEQASMTGYFGR